MPSLSLIRHATIPPLSFWAVALTLCLSLGCGGTGTQVKKGSDTPTTTGSAPSFEAVDLNGDDLDLSTHLGKDVILISFWATWCEPCKAEMPALQEMHENWADKGLKIVSVALDGPDTQSGVEPYIATQRYTFTVVIDEDTAIVQSYNPKATAPYTVIIDRAGNIAKRKAGFQLSEVADLKASVKALLEQP